MDKFHALADLNRRRIVEMLAKDGELTATGISERFPVSAPAISQHLKVLREANLVLMEKRGQQRIYRVNPDALSEVQDWTKRITELWNERFEALDRLIEAEKKKTSRREK